MILGPWKHEEKISIPKGARIIRNPNTWRCEYCDRENDGDALTCGGCQAGRIVSRRRRPPRPEPRPRPLNRGGMK